MNRLASGLLFHARSTLGDFRPRGSTATQCLFMHILPRVLRKLAACAVLGLLSHLAAFAEDAKPATPPPPPAPTLEQRIASLEAYVGNGDPTAGLKDAK